MTIFAYRVGETDQLRTCLKIYSMDYKWKLPKKNFHGQIK